jgi:hypothetical protein
MRLKRWESPRRKGRNDKGKGGAARQRQLKKQTQMLRKRLKGEQGKGECSPFFYSLSIAHHPNSRTQGNGSDLLFRVVLEA